MIFRTGSVLIVGHCDEQILTIIYKFLRKLLTDEFLNIEVNGSILQKKKKKVKKKRKRQIIIW